jgi:hypothetical protein
LCSGCASAFVAIHDYLKTIQSERDHGRLDTGALIVGSKVKLMYRNQACALGVLEFVGGDEGKHRGWGQDKIGRGRTLIRIERVTMNSVRPTYSYKPDAVETAARAKGWKNN